MNLAGSCVCFRKRGGLFYAPFFGDFYQNEDYEGDDYEGYQGYEEASYAKDLLVNFVLKGCKVFEAWYSEAYYWHD